MIFKLGETETLAAGDSLYCIGITETGACVAANNEKDLKTGLFFSYGQNKNIGR